LWKRIEELEAGRDEWKAKFEWAAGKLKEASEGQWVSCEDRLPGQCVIVVTMGGYEHIPRIAQLEDHKWIGSDYSKLCGVTHWMPLPTPPEDK
jgi:hypothetical protein